MYTRCPFLWHHVHPAIPIIFAYMAAIALASMLKTSFTDPGVCMEWNDDGRVLNQYVQLLLLCRSSLDICMLQPSMQQQQQQQTHRDSIIARSRSRADHGPLNIAIHARFSVLLEHPTAGSATIVLVGIMLI